MRGFQFRPVKLSIKAEILLGFAVNDTVRDVELLRDQRLQTQTV